MKKDCIANLKSAINVCLYGPGGDPIDENLRPAALILLVLDKEGCLGSVDKESLAGWVRQLSSDGNVCEEDYIDEFKLNHLKPKEEEKNE